MNLKEITPKKFMCHTNSCCPAVFEVVGEDKLVIIGNKANINTPEFLKRIGENEEAIIIDKKLITQIFEDKE